MGADPLGASHVRGRRTRGGEKANYGRGPARTNSPFAQPQTCAVSARHLVQRSHGGGKYLFGQQSDNNAPLLMQQGIGPALGVEYFLSLYYPSRFCYKRLYPDLVSISVIVWEKHQPTGAAVARFRDFLLMSLRHGEP